MPAPAQDAMAEKQAKVRKRGGLGPILRGFRPAVPATVGAFALTFLFAAMMPMPWIASICWNLYLDTIHPIFAAPLGNAARAGVAFGFALIAALIALVAALALVKPAVKGNRAMNQRVAARARQTQFEDDDTGEDSQALRRRRVDSHPDAPAVAPINAARDLPAGGLGPVVAPHERSPAPVSYGLSDLSDDEEPFDLGMAMQVDSPADDTLALGGGQHTDASPLLPTPAIDADDGTLGAMVARFESGLDRRRNRPSIPATPGAPPAANEDDDPAVDLALEAALSTLQRMSRSAIG